MVVLVLILGASSILFSVAAAPVLIPTNNAGASSFATFSPTHITSRGLLVCESSHPNGCEVVSPGFLTGTEEDGHSCLGQKLQ